MGIIFKKYTFWFSVLLLVSCFFSGRVQAFSVFPLRQTLVLDPGSTEKVFFDVKNESAQEAEFVFGVDAFALKSTNGNIVFGQSDAALIWVTPNIESKILKAGESQRVIFHVQVPRGVIPGLHPLALVATQKSSGGQVGISGRIASLLFLHIAGNVEEKLDLEKFSFEKPVAFSSPVPFVVALKNDGNTYVVPQGRVLVSTWWGKDLESVILNRENQKILPAGIFERRETLILPWYVMGPVYARGNLQYGLTEQTLSFENTLWYFSWKMIFIFVAGIVFFVSMSLFKKRSHF